MSGDSGDNDSGESGERGRAEDVVIFRGPTEDGGGVRVVRARGKDDTIEFGEVRPLRDGQAVTGEIVSLAPRTFDEDGTPRICDVKVLYDARTRSGPAQVATTAYRESWDAIFGQRAGKREELAN